jgi:hypothetical protein
VEAGEEMTQPDPKYLLWKDVPEEDYAPLEWRIPEDRTSVRGECKAATIYSRQKFKYWEGEPKWGQCNNGIWGDEFCYAHHPTKHKKPIPWWKRIKLQAPVKWGKK